MYINKKNVLYRQYLNNINTIKFTSREIDIISCLMHNRGEKKIGSLLQISPRTVGSHLHNIMLKTGKNSREDLIDFIEKSGKLVFIKEYYLEILTISLFEQKLIEIGQRVNRNKICYIVKDHKIGNLAKEKLKVIRKHLALANCDIKYHCPDKAAGFIWIINNHNLIGNKKDDILCLLDDSLDENDYLGAKYINFQNNQNYYLSCFSLLEKLIRNKAISQKAKEFLSDYQAIKRGYAQLETDNSENETNDNLQRNITPLPPSSFLENLEKSKESRVKIIVFMLASLALLNLISFIFYKNFIASTEEKPNNHLRSELSLPHDSLLLEADEIFNKIKKNFSDKSVINTVALVGIGGSGKSILAKRFARNSDAKIIWKIDAESKGSLISSMKNIALMIASKDIDKRVKLEQILSIPKITERERALLLFIQNEMKQNPGWLLIYDNIRNFHSIEEFYPHDPNLWGTGNIIITTNNDNIANNDILLAQNTIRINPLSEEQKRKLFNNIVNLKDGRYNQCLNNIPSFPLDVSIAAHYLRETNMDCYKYLEYLSSDDIMFANSQRRILSDVSEYSKTRYDIVIQPIQYILEKSSDFKNLLIAISMMAPNNIPKDLLISYKNDIIVDNFIYELKKFSMINGVEKTENNYEFFSINDSTHNIIYAYFLKESQNIEVQKIISNYLHFINKHLLKITEKQDVNQIQRLIPHLERILKGAYPIDQKLFINLKQKLGTCYFYLGWYKKAKETFENTLKLYGKNDKLELAWALARLGGANRNTGNYFKAQEYLEKSLNIYRQCKAENTKKAAWAKTMLGSVYRNIGNYSKSEQTLRASYKTHKELYGKQHKKVIWAKSYLGQLYKNLGNYKKACEIMNQTYNLYKQEYGKVHSKTAWALVHLGSIYRSMGCTKKAKNILLRAVETYRLTRGENSIEYAWSTAHLSAIYKDLKETDKAIELLTNSLNLYKKYLEPDHIINGWIKYHLGNIYRIIGDLDNAFKLLNDSLRIHEIHYKKDHIKIAQIFNSIGHLKIHTQDLSGAKEYLTRSMMIYETYRHNDIYKVYESMGDMYLSISKKQNDEKHALKQAMDHFQKSLTILEKNFPANSIHISRVRRKIAGFV